MFPPKAFSADSFQFRQVGFASIEKSRLMQYTVHVLPYYPTNANAIVAHYLPYCPTFYTRQRCRRGGAWAAGEVATHLAGRETTALVVLMTNPLTAALVVLMTNPLTVPMTTVLMMKDLTTTVLATTTTILAHLVMSSSATLVMSSR